MKHQIFTVYDSKAEVYTLPFFLSNQQMAQRTFKNWINDPQHTFGRNPEDYTLFHIGEYDDDNATAVQDKIESLGIGIQFKTQEDQQ